MQLLVSSLFVQVLVFAAGAPEIDDHSDALIHPQTLTRPHEHGDDDGPLLMGLDQLLEDSEVGDSSIGDGFSKLGSNLSNITKI